MDITELMMIMGGGGGGGGSSIVSIQYVSITCSGATSNTASISAVDTARSFLVYAGSNTAATSAPGQAQGRAVLTSSTQVTAYKNSATDSFTWTGYVVEMDASTVDLVEYGTITLGTGATSNTATLSGSFTTSQSAVFFLGQESTAATTSSRSTAVRARIKLTAASTVTAYKALTGTDTDLVVGFIAVKFNSAKIASVQHVECSETGTNATWTASISSVTPANCLVAFGGITAAGGTNNNSNHVFAGALTGATTVTAYSGTSTSLTKYFNCVVIEFVSGVVAGNQNVIDADFASNSNTSSTETISSVSTTKSIVSYMGVNLNSSAANWTNLSFTTQLTNATTVTSSRTGTGSVVNMTVYACVTEFA